MNHRDKFLISKAWGFGFFADVFVTLTHLMIAELTNRKSIVHWGSNSLYHSLGITETFSSFFQGHTLSSIDAIPNAGETSYFPGKWHRGNIGEDNVMKWQGAGSRLHGRDYLNRIEDVVVCDFYTSIIEILEYLPADSPYFGQEITLSYRQLIERYLNPTEAITERARKLYRDEIGNRPVIAVHFRGTDKAKEIQNTSVEEILRVYIDTIDKISTASGVRDIFLLTDDSAALDILKRRYPGRIIHTDCSRLTGNEGIHYMEPGWQRGLEALIDALIAIKCPIFIGNGLSNMSCYIDAAKDWQGQSILLGGNMLQLKNSFIYRVASPDFPNQM